MSCVLRLIVGVVLLTHLQSGLFGQGASFSLGGRPDSHDATRGSNVTVGGNCAFVDSWTGSPTKETWSVLEQFPDLEKLDICKGGELDDASINRLVSFQSLKTLHLNSVEMRDDSFRSISELSNLENLVLINCSISTDGLHDLIFKCPKLSKVQVYECPKVTVRLANVVVNTNI